MQLKDRTKLSPGTSEISDVADIVVFVSDTQRRRATTRSFLADDLASGGLSAHSLRLIGGTMKVSASSPGVSVGGRAVLCDCHCGPMYYFPVSLMPKGDFVMCWVSDCGRCYNETLGYFNLRATRRTLGSIHEGTRSTALCPNENCATRSYMVLTRSDGASTGEDNTCWYCFYCGTEFPCRNILGFWEQLLRKFRPAYYQRLSAKHSPIAFRGHRRPK
jgi:hypothetical protein